LISFTVMVNVSTSVSTPPLATPPSSVTVTVTVAEPLESAASV